MLATFATIVSQQSQQSQGSQGWKNTGNLYKSNWCFLCFRATCHMIDQPQGPFLSHKTSLLHLIITTRTRLTPHLDYHRNRLGPDFQILKLAYDILSRELLNQPYGSWLTPDTRSIDRPSLLKKPRIIRISVFPDERRPIVHTEAVAMYYLV